MEGCTLIITPTDPSPRRRWRRGGCELYHIFKSRGLCAALHASLAYRSSRYASGDSRGTRQEGRVSKQGGTVRLPNSLRAKKKQCAGRYRRALKHLVFQETSGHSIVLRALYGRGRVRRITTGVSGMYSNVLGFPVKSPLNGQLSGMKKQSRHGLRTSGQR